MPKVVITMPAYRAAETLARTVDDIPPGLADHLILVDDASTDNTVQLAHELGIRVFVHPNNQGYGANQKTCYAMALQEDADVVVLLHPDYQYDPKAVPLLIAPILGGDADMTFGSRFAGLGDPRGGGMPMYRYVGNRVTTVLENLMLGSRFTEMHSGLRAYSRKCLLSLPFLRYTDDFAFDSQLLVDAVTLGQRVVEVPIPTRYTKESSSIAVGSSFRYIARSLAYCAQKTASRGRRGHRSPVARPWAATNPAGVARVETRTRASAEEIARGYELAEDGAYLAEEMARRRLFEWTARAMGGYATRAKRLLEIGSGVGLFLEVAGGRGWLARGVEPSFWAVKTGRDRYGVNLRQGSVETLSERHESVDAIVALDVLEHLADPGEALRRLRPAMDDEGILVLSAMNAAGHRGRLPAGTESWTTRSHLHSLSPRTLTAMLEGASFRVVEWSGIPKSLKGTTGCLPDPALVVARPA